MNKTAFITGAGAGIGKAIAQRLHRDGWFVGLYDVDLPAVEALAQTLGARATAGRLDVTDRAAWDLALADFSTANSGAATGPLQLLVNNAGVLDSGPFEATAPANHQRMVAINFSGVIHGCHAAHPFLRRAERACVINLASASAIYGQPALATYSATKFAVRGLTEALNLEWEAQGIRVCDIWPLFVQTAMVQGMKADSIERMGVKLRPEDVAAVVARAAHSRRSQVHWTVGFEAGLFARLVRLAPPALARWVVRRLVM